MSDTDLQLLARYTRQHAEDAFAEIVRRHLDLVFSAALRQVRSPQLAEEVAQSTFTDLARNAAKLTNATGGSPVLTAWLYQVTRRTAIDVVRRESRRQLREQIATDMNAMNAAADDWGQIEPLLDEAMHALDDTDRAAVLLRYFENKSLREVGETLGASEDAARKRISRAVERLREFFIKRGVTVGTSGLVVVIAANAVQAAPVGLAVTISTAAAMAGATVAATIATQTTMNWINIKSIAAIVIAALASGTATHLVQQREVKRLRSENQNLISQQQRLTSERDKAANELTTSRDENKRLNRNTTELLRLRAETAKLQRELRELRAQTASSKRTSEASPSVSTVQSQNAVVFVGGEVNVPGRKVWTQGMKLTDAIRMSEMLTSFADKKASVTDSSGTRNDYDLRDVLSGKAENPLLKPGDRVQVPRLENSLNVDPATEIHMGGAVVLPSHWPWTNGLSLTAAITMVGGLTEYADGRVEVIRRGKGTGNIYNLPEIQSGRAQNPILESGDHVQAQPVRAPSN